MKHRRSISPGDSCSEQDPPPINYIDYRRTSFATTGVLPSAQNRRSFDAEQTCASLASVLTGMNSFEEELDLVSHEAGLREINKFYGDHPTDNEQGTHSLAPSELHKIVNDVAAGCGSAATDPVLAEKGERSLARHVDVNGTGTKLGEVPNDGANIAEPISNPGTDNDLQEGVPKLAMFSRSGVTNDAGDLGSAESLAYTLCTPLRSIPADLADSQAVFSAGKNTFCGEMHVEKEGTLPVRLYQQRAAQHRNMPDAMADAPNSRLQTPESGSQNHGNYAKGNREGVITTINGVGSNDKSAQDQSLHMELDKRYTGLEEPAHIKERNDKVLYDETCTSDVGEGTGLDAIASPPANSPINHSPTLNRVVSSLIPRHEAPKTPESPKATNETIETRKKEGKIKPCFSHCQAKVVNENPRLRQELRNSSRTGGQQTLRKRPSGGHLLGKREMDALSLTPEKAVSRRASGGRRTRAQDRTEETAAAAVKRRRRNA